MDNQRTEPEIVRGLQNGHSDAWAALCEQYGVRLWRYVATLIGNNDAAVADVFQETMLAVAGAGRTLRSGSCLWAWLAAIAHNQSAMFWRKHSRERALRGGDSGEVLTADDPADVLSQQEQNELVRRLLSEMTALDALMLTAKYMDGLSVQEIVEQHGGTAESVRSRLARARREFRERFERMHQKVNDEVVPHPIRRL